MKSFQEKNANWGLWFDIGILFLQPGTRCEVANFSNLGGLCLLSYGSKRKQRSYNNDTGCTFQNGRYQVYFYDSVSMFIVQSHAGTSCSPLPSSNLI